MEIGQPQHSVSFEIVIPRSMDIAANVAILAEGRLRFESVKIARDVATITKPCCSICKVCAPVHPSPRPLTLSQLWYCLFSDGLHNAYNLGEKNVQYCGQGAPGRHILVSLNQIGGLLFLMGEKADITQRDLSQTRFSSELWLPA